MLIVTAVVMRSVNEAAVASFDFGPELSLGDCRKFHAARCRRGMQSANL